MEPSVYWICLLSATPILSSLHFLFCKCLSRTRGTPSRMNSEEHSEPPNELSPIQSHLSSMPPIQRNERTDSGISFDVPRLMTRNQHYGSEATTTVPVHSPSSLQSHLDAINSFSSDPPPPYPGRDTSR